ncbi:MAG: lysine exporter LysO family protein [Candidatus Methylomirabilales bacterium]
MRNSLPILACFLGGILLGLTSLVPSGPLLGQLTDGTLYGLLFLIGLVVGGSHGAWRGITLSPDLGLVPLAAILGTLAGVSLAAAALPGLALSEALAVGAGFGYYSLSSILVTSLRGEALGVVTLLANLLREILTLLLAPVLARLFGPLAPIASGGATAMDTTLPVIVQAVGADYAMLAVWSGLVLSLLAPLLISIFL